MRKTIVSIVLSLVMATIPAFVSLGAGWTQDTTGWQYIQEDGNSIKSNWFQDVNGKWYYFEETGYIAHDKWINNTYYVDSNGVMLANTTTPDGYWVGPDGKYVPQNRSSNVYNETYEYYKGGIHCIADVTIVYPDQFRGPKSGITHKINGFSIDKDGNLYVNVTYVPGSSFGIYSSRHFNFSIKRTVNNKDTTSTDMLYLYANSGTTNEFVMNLQANGTYLQSGIDTMYIAYTIRFSN